MMFSEDTSFDRNDINLKRQVFTPKRTEIILTEAKKTAPLGVEILECKRNRN